MIRRLSRLPFLPPSSMMLAVLVVSAMIAGIFEWEHYRRLFQWQHHQVACWDNIVLFWLMMAKSLWVLLPLLLSVGLVIGLGWRRVGWGIAVLGLATISCWLVADVRVRENTGNHLLLYLKFVGGDRPLTYAGQASIVDLSFGVLLIGVAVGTIAILVLCRWFMQSLPRHSVGTAGLFLVAAFGVLAAGPSLRQPILFERLASALPVQLGSAYTGAPSPLALSEFREDLTLTTANVFRNLRAKMMAGQPADEDARLTGGSLPNVIVLVLESFRHDSICPEYMLQLDRWARKGLRFERHYAGSNCSQYGLFSLLYGRSSLAYDFTLDARVPPQAPLTFRQSGYRTTFLTSGCVNWMRMDEFINEKQFDKVILQSSAHWPEDDRTILRSVERLARDNNGQPQFIVAFTMSTHCDYQYPKEYERHRPVIDGFRFTDSHLRGRRPEILNRYRNALAFMDDEISNMVERLDPRRNIIVVTGDHGESFWEDGCFTHVSKASEIQTRVPLVMFGPGIPAGLCTAVTRHADILPTLLHAVAGHSVPLAHTHGVDALADGFANRQTALHPFCGLGSSRNLVLIRDRQRLRVWLHFDQAKVQVDGFYDPLDNPDTRALPKPEETSAWRDMLLAELRRYCD
jgi:arylsulfatase A-like enzyme